MPRITDFCGCIYVLGCRLSLVRLCDIIISSSGSSSSSSSSNITIIIIEFFTSQVRLGNIHLSLDAVINRFRLCGLICSFLQLNMCLKLQIFADVFMYVFGCKLSVVRLWNYSRR